MSEERLEIKTIPQEPKAPIGKHPEGGIVFIEGKSYWLRHPSYRWHTQKKSWGNDEFSNDDLSKVGYHLILLPKELTREIANSWLSQLKEGALPEKFTIGTEVEGILYDKDGNLLAKHNNLEGIINDLHPELMSFTVETATSKNPEGAYPKNPVETAKALVLSILEGYRLADNRGGVIVYSSVPEGGNFFQGEITSHPYLLFFAPQVLEFTLSNQEKIPQEVINFFQKIYGIQILDYFKKTGILNWPTHALHVHTGLPEFDNLVDPRAAYACGIIRLTLLFSKLPSLFLYNTRHLYGRDSGLRDVRSIIRRALATTLNSDLPETAEILMKNIIKSLTIGEIHSPSRYPITGQHDRVRFRSEAQFKTIESIDAPMTPDLRLALMWIYFNQILNVIALDALYQVEGDESLVISYLLKIWVVV